MILKKINAPKGAFLFASFVVYRKRDRQIRIYI